MREDADAGPAPNQGAPFVGRARELSVLASAAERARRGEPAVVAVQAAAGMGKSSLLSHFAATAGDVVLVRASGDEAELLHPYGVIEQLAASARSGASRLADGLDAELDPLAVGADLLCLLGDLQSGGAPVVLIVDDLHWLDELSSRALLFALRRLQRDRVLVLVSGRPEGLGGMGDGWRRFLAGDHRVNTVRLPGLGPEDLVVLCREMGRGELSPRAAARLAEQAEGNPLYCRAVLEEVDAGSLHDGALAPRVPRVLSDVITQRLAGLSIAARELITAAAVLGRRCRLATAVALAELAVPSPALDEAVAAGLLTEEHAAGTELVFTQSLIRDAIHDEIGSTERRGLHQRAALLTSGEERLDHLVAAATGPDDQLADELAAAADSAPTQAGTARVARWRSLAATLSGRVDVRERRLLDALEALVACGDVPGAQRLMP